MCLVQVVPLVEGEDVLVLDQEELSRDVGEEPHGVSVRCLRSI